MPFVSRELLRLCQHAEHELTLLDIIRYCVMYPNPLDSTISFTLVSYI